jgi:hypothetical protein
MTLAAALALGAGLAGGVAEFSFTAAPAHTTSRYPAAKGSLNADSTIHIRPVLWGPTTLTAAQLTHFYNVLCASSNAHAPSGYLGWLQNE